MIMWIKTVRGIKRENVSCVIIILRCGCVARNVKTGDRREMITYCHTWYGVIRTLSIPIRKRQTREMILYIVSLSSPQCPPPSLFLSQSVYLWLGCVHFFSHPSLSIEKRDLFYRSAASLGVTAFCEIGSPWNINVYLTLRTGNAGSGWWWGKGL